MSFITSITVAGAYASALDTAQRAEPARRKEAPAAKTRRFALPFWAIWAKRAA